uniref:50S ribosomal protein S9 n=1 Tax=Symbiochloris sp. SG-2018 TaxID=2126034 RepID=UPI002113FA5D|nr:50S ribosomal protein S9 [Symbiochloris sp. SG-2018]UTQ75716.1 50S ribosomal protein S9 [Symbiochloris sp. SG-2018]
MKPFRGTGRRKSSIAEVQLIQGYNPGQFLINQISATSYMQQNPNLIHKIQEPLELLNLQNELTILVKVKGGGLVGQANAIKLGLSRAIVAMDPHYRPSLKNFLTRDARCKERKKYGLKKARKAPQFSKR